jgi:hypothetical protein
MQGQGLDGRIILQVLAHRQHPLAHRHARHDVVGEMGGGFDHALFKPCMKHSCPMPMPNGLPT